MDNVTFPDSGLHLAVLGALLDEGAVAEDAIRAALADVDPSEEERYRIREAVNCLSSYELLSTPIFALERLNFDGGNSIYMLIERVLDVDTGGEADYYQLGSLDGIGLLQSLTTLNLDGHGYREQDLDLLPLANHARLSSLHLTGRCINAKVLESLPMLTSLRLPYGTIDDPTVLDRLTQRGVKVQGRQR